MKKLNFLLLALLLGVMPALQSCDNNDGYSIGDFGADWATVRTAGGDTYSLTGDTWGTLWPAATSIPWYKPVDGQRVVVYFNPLSDKFQDYDHAIKVEGIREVLTKQVEEMTAENEAEFGNDPIVIYKGNMWISGGYLNLIFCQDLPAKEKHRISLVHRASLVDDREDGYFHLELLYNTYGDTTDRWVNGAVSFNLNSLKADGMDMKGIKVKLNSLENGKDVEVIFDFKEQTTPENAKQATLSEDVKVK